MSGPEIAISDNCHTKCGLKPKSNQTLFVDSLVTCPNVPVLAGHPTPS